VLPALGREIRLREAAPADILTEREREILLLMCEGLSAPAIAERMNLSLSTVKTHQAHLFEKLGANERAMAVARAFRRRLIE
jgi:two-component system nitrate/nitrite response regulator NarL